MIAPGGVISDKDHPQVSTPTQIAYTDGGVADQFGQIQKNVNFPTAFPPGVYTINTTLTAKGPIGQPADPSLGDGISINVQRDPNPQPGRPADSAFYTLARFHNR